MYQTVFKCFSSSIGSKNFTRVYHFTKFFVKNNMCLCSFRIPPMIGNPGLKSATNGKTRSLVESFTTFYHWSVIERFI